MSQDDLAGGSTYVCWQKINHVTGMRIRKMTNMLFRWVEATSLVLVNFPLSIFLKYDMCTA